MMKYHDLTLGQVEAVINKLGGYLGVKRLLRDELSILPRTRTPMYVSDDIIQFSVTSNGLTGPAWVKRLRDKGNHFGADVEMLLLSKDFTSTSGITTKIVAYRGCYFSDVSRHLSHICHTARMRRLVKPSMEIACLILDTLSRAEIDDLGIGLMVVVHEPPLFDSNFINHLAVGIGKMVVVRSKGEAPDEPETLWNKQCCFVFAGAGV